MKRHRTTRLEMRRWSSNLYLAKEIVFCTDYLIKHEHGYPGSLYRKYCPDMLKEITPKQEEAAMNEWKDILQQIHDGFKIYYQNGDSRFYEYPKGAKRPRWNQKKQTFEQYINDPTHPKLVRNREKEKKFKTAMKLFACWFDNLWD